MYLITTTYNNGYGCSCCKAEWNLTKWDDTLPELSYVTSLIEKSDSYEDSNEVGIRIEDGTNGNLVYAFFMDLHKATGKVVTHSTKHDAINEYSKLLDKEREI